MKKKHLIKSISDSLNFEQNRNRGKCPQADKNIYKNSAVNNMVNGEKISAFP